MTFRDFLSKSIKNITTFLQVREAVIQLPPGTICIYGNDDYAAKVKEQIQKMRKDITVRCFLDTYEFGDFNTLPLLTPGQLIERHIDYDYILIVSKLWEEIEWLLTDNSLDDYYSITDFPSRFRSKFKPQYVRYLIWKSTIKGFLKRKEIRRLVPKQTGKVYDCFSFFNELDLLEIRLNELDSVVDYFVLVEATRTHTGKVKALFFDENKDRFAEFLHKIIHVKVDDFPRYNGKNSWRLEKFQRNALERGLTEAKLNDVLIISDLDEIPKPETIIKYKNTSGIKLFCQSWYRFYLNYLNASFPIWRYGSRMGTLADLEQCRFPSLRPECPKFAVNEFYRYAPHYPVSDGGWHFSFLGGIDQVMEKISSLARPDNGLPTTKARELIQSKIARGEDISGNGYKLRRVEPDHTFPRYVLENIDKFSNLLVCSKESRDKL